MSQYAFPPAPQAAVPVLGSDKLFPVRRILCVGRNYAAHRREMGGDDRDPPFFFAKPADALVLPGVDVPYPSATANLHHEIELVAAIGEGGKVFGYAVGVDLTRRDLQNAAKDKGQPWEAGKAFDHSAPISAIRPGDVDPEAAIEIRVNGAVRQSASIGDMIWSVPEIVEQARRLWTLAPGDLIFTGTPEGVAAIVRGDHVEGSVAGVGALSFTVV
ncbi:fumarylpyruvate hydrolase [Caulobacter ginsengisoli]|uniref:Fumarylpyruvate hydrolase n=1 Tax=Caulobacter ginsengisoli TaxID=400775 RepID=A0ABU0IV12_9CAUL|nr:fumarylacetoacetate hydrolase family protein [Caulobacter ginsengisoli]MDQ0464879.1 fumarylpyruvate hydrolase [Caulobacter ginsengisoli]